MNKKFEKSLHDFIPNYPSKGDKDSYIVKSGTRIEHVKTKLTENNIIKSTINKASIKINVKFESLQIRALLDKNDEIIDGNDKKEILVKDEWVFEKKINDNNPNWTLIETKSY